MTTKNSSVAKRIVRAKRPFYEDLLMSGLQENYMEALKLDPGEVDDKKLRLFNAAMLCRFVSEYENGSGIDRSVLEFLYHVFVDVLGGMPFDEVLKLPGRKVLPEWDSLSSAERNRLEAAMYVSDSLSKGIFKREADAVEEAAKLWSKTESWVRSARTEWDPKGAKSAGQTNSRKKKKSGMTI